MRVVRAFDQWWWTVAIAAGAVLAHLNRDALGMQGVLPDYRCFRAVVVAGLDPSANHCASPTFPMWGYGWLLAVTGNEYALLLFQVVLATAGAATFLWTLESVGVLRTGAARLAKIALLVSVPWYASNALRWPYSEAASLLLLAVALLVLALAGPTADYVLFALSGALLGLALNFRSDYIALPALILIVVLALARQRGALLRPLAVWIAAIVVLLVPWMVYSARATGNVLVTSTNSGHVLYISLGQLPGNPWGITPSDGDPRMHRELDAHFGRHVSSLTYSSDTFLRSRFFHLVREHPTAWLHKDLRNAVHTLTDGLYNGEFIDEASCGTQCWTRYGYAADGTHPTRSRLQTLFGSSGLGVVRRIRFALVELSAQEGRLVSFLGFLVSAVVLLVALRRRTVLLAVVAAVPVYTWLLNTFAYELPSYSSNVYVFAVVLLAIAVMRAATDLARWAHAARGSGSGSGSTSTSGGG